MGKKVKDLTGMRFGRLTVIERRGSDKRGNAMWLCKCECGNEVIVSSEHLRSGNTTSCGCSRIKDLTGIKFGKLTVIKRYESDKHGNLMWLCECECGNKKIINGNSLKSGATKSCGCVQKELLRHKMREQMKEMWRDETFRQTHRNIKHNYKGGITPISSYLGHLPIVKQWFDDSKKQANYTCELTGKVGGNLHTHHLKAFSTIVKEAHELHNIQIHEITGEYTDEELKLLEEYVTNWHKDNSNAVVLCYEVHKLFHSLYGKGNNTPEQFEEFKQRYFNGEFDKLLNKG